MSKDLGEIKTSEAIDAIYTARRAFKPHSTIDEILKEAKRKLG